MIANQSSTILYLFWLLDQLQFVLCIRLSAWSKSWTIPWEKVYEQALQEFKGGVTSDDINKVKVWIARLLAIAPRELTSRLHTSDGKEIEVIWWAYRATDYRSWRNPVGFQRNGFVALNALTKKCRRRDACQCPYLASCRNKRAIELAAKGPASIQSPIFCQHLAVSTILFWLSFFIYQTGGKIKSSLQWVSACVQHFWHHLTLNGIPRTPKMSDIC